jgi:catechol 2,3-dioxygenase-like lactoylglutathione lyase family enzyme
MISRVTHVTIFVLDQDEALKFYRDKLGFKVHTDLPMGDSRWLTLNAPEQSDFEVVLLQAENPQEKALVGKQAGEKPLLCFVTDDCRGTIKQLKDKGVKVIVEPREQPWGIESLFQDLYGNVIDLVQPPA